MTNNTDASSREKATIRKNPAPKQAYRLIMTIENAPGPFAEMVGMAQYDVTNTECLRPPKDNPGGYSSPVPTTEADLTFKKIGENQYETVVYADYMLDEDYTGRGVCHWKLIQARVHMKATGAAGETTFIPSIPDETLLAEKKRAIYFPRTAYPKASMENYIDFGTDDRGRFGPSMQDSDLFTVTFDVTQE